MPYQGLSEKAEQKLLVSFLKVMKAEWRGVRRWHCDLSGMHTRSFKSKVENSAMWLTPWFPDLMVVYADSHGKEHGLFIEMKRSDGWTVSPDQWEWIETLNRCWYDAQVCKGFVEARDLVLDRIWSFAGNKKSQ